MVYAHDVHEVPVLGEFPVLQLDDVNHVERDLLARRGNALPLSLVSARESLVRPDLVALRRLVEYGCLEVWKAGSQRSENSSDPFTVLEARRLSVVEPIRGDVLVDCLQPALTLNLFDEATNYGLVVLPFRRQFP